MSAQICGCDPDHVPQHFCERFPDCDHGRYVASMRRAFPLGTQPLTSDFSQPLPITEYAKTVTCGQPRGPETYAKGVRSGLFPDSAQGRKDHPVFTGVLMYFPHAIAAISRVSKKGNDQHNPGEPLHWARSKSTDQTDTALRHMMDHGTGTPLDEDGEYHLAKAAWRIMAELELTIERLEGK